LTQDKTLSQKDSAFKAPSVATVIIGRYPNFAVLPQEYLLQSFLGEKNALLKLKMHRALEKTISIYKTCANHQRHMTQDDADMLLLTDGLTQSSTTRPWNWPD